MKPEAEKMIAEAERRLAERIVREDAKTALLTGRLEAVKGRALTPAERAMVRDEVRSPSFVGRRERDEYDVDLAVDREHDRVAAEDAVAAQRITFDDDYFYDDVLADSEHRYVVDNHPAPKGRS